MRGIGKVLKRHIPKRNNQGMTLIEILVAITILGVVIVPTMHMFVSSSSHNLRSRRQQRATTIAESAMESFKAYSMEDLVYQFREVQLHQAGDASHTKASLDFKGDLGLPTVKASVMIRNTSGSLMSFDAVPTGDSDVNAVWMSKPAIHASASLKDYLSFPGVLNPAAGLYEFKMKDVAMEAETYDITVKATPRALNDSAGNAALSATPSVLKTEDFNQYKDAVINFKQNQKYFLPGADPTVTGNNMDFKSAVKQAIINELKARNPGNVDPAYLDYAYSNSLNGLTGAEKPILHSFSRVISVNVSTESGGDKVKVSSFCQFKFQLPVLRYDKGGVTETITNYGYNGNAASPYYNDIVLTIKCNVNDFAQDDTGAWIAYDNTNTLNPNAVAGIPGGLESVYLYYTPAYYDISTVMPSDFVYDQTDYKDYIEIHNLSSHSDLDVVVMKQYPEGSFATNGKLRTTMVSQLNTSDPYYSRVFLLTCQGSAKIRTNLLENIMVEEAGKTDENGAIITADALYGGLDVVRTHCKDGSGGATLSDDRCQIFRTATSTLKQKALIYDIEVSVTYAGEDDVLAVFTGTINER